jgi:hypothetical protein
LIDYSHDCRQTISPQRWALVGEAGRFTDPLYSPGSDLISIYNTLIVDAIQNDSDEELKDRCRTAEVMQRVMYESYVPSYAVTYDCLGDQEAFTLKYTWELAVYFGFFVLPMFNGLFANRQFIPQFLRRYGALGTINANLQRMLSSFFQWKKHRARVFAEPNLIEFYDMAPLRDAEKLFYQAGLTADEAIAVLDRHLDRLREFARYIITHIYAATIGDRGVLENASFIASIDLRNTSFNPEEMAASYARHADCAERHQWNLNPNVLAEFIQERFESPARGRMAGELSPMTANGAAAATALS